MMCARAAPRVWLELQNHLKIMSNSHTREPFTAEDVRVYPKGIRYKIFVVEVLFILYTSSAFYYVQLSQQYYYQYVMYKNVSHYVDLGSQSLCINQSFAIRYVSNATYVELQKEVNNINMYVNVIYLSLSAFVALFTGPLSDVVGRKPVILLMLLGVFINSTIQLFIVYYHLDARYYYVTSFFYGALGGFYPFLSQMFASVTDVTASKKIRAVRMGILEGLTTLGRAFSAISVFYLVPLYHCDFRTPVWLTNGLITAAILYFLFVPEPLQMQPHQPKMAGLKNHLYRIFTGAKIFILPRYLGFVNWIRLLAATVTIALYGMVIISGYKILAYFLYNRPLEWSYTHIGLYAALTAVENWACLNVIFPILVMMKMPHPLIILTATGFGMGANILIATVSHDWEMYLGRDRVVCVLTLVILAGALQGISLLGYPSIRAILADLVSAKDTGMWVCAQT